MVSPADDLAILVEIDQIHQQLFTRGLSPGGTHAYSSNAHPESSSEYEAPCLGPEEKGAPLFRCAPAGRPASPHSEGPTDALVHPAGCRSDSLIYNFECTPHNRAARRTRPRLFVLAHTHICNIKPVYSRHSERERGIKSLSLFSPLINPGGYGPVKKSIQHVFCTGACMCVGVCLETLGVHLRNTCQGSSVIAPVKRGRRVEGRKGRAETDGGEL
ncbi:hypothetical protein EYF80_016095 [Liparis tanakae]|uniref:Uncharacterized protein n=1 Tax=Liparis tanakae TaxID=230148 RepID=A0A4Z2I8H9_9TELE|nr:hypothetical protein EYF80_016095 [Liparis tanakae]